MIIKLTQTNDTAIYVNMSSTLYFYRLPDTETTTIFASFGCGSGGNISPYMFSVKETPEEIYALLSKD